MIYSSKNPFYFGVANNDEFPEIVIDSVPVPDFISDVSNQPKAQVMLVDRVVRLNQFGVNIIAMACNTAHLLYPVLSSYSEAKFISMIDSVSYLASQKGYQRVGLFASPTTIKSDLYQVSLCRFQIEVIYPSVSVQNNLETIIRDVISGKKLSSQADYLLQTAKAFIRDQQLDGLILGCTELPLVFPKEKLEVIDSLDVLAECLLNVTI